MSESKRRIPVHLRRSARHAGTATKRVTKSRAKAVRHRRKGKNLGGGVTFDEILPVVKQGGKARRQLWDGLNLGAMELVQIQTTDGKPCMAQLLVVGREGTLRPFAGSQWDLLADDWYLL